ncbi:ankyrin repeat domain-containing protein 26-like isoform X1 [Erinaceus europaeus]|uniref:Ankyrin repeat domain-containing protein 26-like isoform X1 n=1 Tax=Erinaceus europaeus TaxID=9365 RepID=A0ABM3XKJ6_ERIEU|nr:ankyrin repeat domain-containing protein 26-like isoform X1 [Erinaceus europaeus]
MRRILGFRSPAPSPLMDSSEAGSNSRAERGAVAQPSLWDQLRDKEPSKLHKAASAGDVAKVQRLLLLGKSDLNDRDKLDRTALHLACANGHREVVTLLVERKCQLDLHDSENKTALVKAVQCQQEECAAILLAHGADPNVMDSYGNTALHYAASCDNLLLAETLLSHNADIEARNKDNLTPLLLAISENKQQMAEFLIKKKANIHAADKIQRLSSKPNSDDSGTTSNEDFNFQTKERTAKPVIGKRESDIDIIQSAPQDQKNNDNLTYDEKAHTATINCSPEKYLHFEPTTEVKDPVPDKAVGMNDVQISQSDFSVWNSTGLTLRDETHQSLKDLKVDDKCLVVSQPASLELGQMTLKNNIGIVFLYGSETPYDVCESQLSENKEKKEEMTSEKDQENREESANDYLQVEEGKTYKSGEVEVSENMCDAADQLIQQRQKEPMDNQLFPIVENEDSDSSGPSLYIKEGKEKERKTPPPADFMIMPVIDESDSLTCSELQVTDDDSLGEIAKNSGRTVKKAPNEKDKVKKQIKFMDILDDSTQSSATISEDCVLPYTNYESFMLLIEQLGKDSKDSVNLLKIQDAVLSYERLIELKGNHCGLLAGKIEKMKNKVSGLQKELSETKEIRSQLELQKVEWDQELCSLRFALKQEEEKRRNAVFLYEKIKEQLRKTEEQYSKEVEVKQQLEFSLQTLNMDLRTLRSNFFQVAEKLNNVQRQLSEQKSARIFQEEILTSRLRKQKELEMIYEKMNSELQKTLDVLQDESEKRHLLLEEKNKELINECNTLKETLHKTENEKVEREATVKQLQEELADTLKKQTMLETSLAVTSCIKLEDKEDLKKKVDDLNAKLETSSSKCLCLTTQNQVLQQELLCMKKTLKKYQKIERNEQKLEEEVVNLKSHIEQRMVDLHQVEQYKVEIEERARQDVTEKLKEVNLFLQEQAASQEYLEQLREDNDALTRNQIELRIQDLESEVFTMKNSQADSYKRKKEIYVQQIANLESELSSMKSRENFHIIELEEYKQLYLEQHQEKMSLENKLKELHRTNESLREIINTHHMEQKQDRSLFSTPPARLESSCMANPKPNLMFQRNLSAKEDLAIPTPSPQHSNNNMEIYMTKMQQQLELNIVRELEEAAAELEPEVSASFLLSSTNKSHETQDLLLKTSQEYVDVLKKNYMI